MERTEVQVDCDEKTAKAQIKYLGKSRTQSMRAVCAKRVVWRNPQI